MPWNSPTAYKLNAENAPVSRSILQLGKSRAGKTRAFQQLVLAYGVDNVLLINNGGALDCLLYLNVVTENARDYGEVVALLDTLHEQRDNLPSILFHDDITKFGDAIDTKTTKEFKHLPEGKDKNIKKFHQVSVDGRSYVTRFNDYPVINIYNLTEGDKGAIMFPGAAFIDHFIRMVGPIITLRAVVQEDEDKTQRIECWYDTRGRGGETGGDRTGTLAPREPPDLPAIIESVFKLKRKYATICESNGSMSRKEEK